MSQSNSAVFAFEALGILYPIDRHEELSVEEVERKTANQLVVEAV